MFSSLELGNGGVGGEVGSWFWFFGFFCFCFWSLKKKKFPSFLTECCRHHYPFFRGLCLYLCPGFCCRKSHCKGEISLVSMS